MAHSFSMFQKVKQYLLSPLRGGSFLVMAKAVSLLCLCLVFSLIRNLKDTLLMTVDPAGPEALSFLKLWGLLPVALAATSLYVWLSRKYSPWSLFKGTVLIYIGYFLVFAFLLFPCRDLLTLSSLQAFMQMHLPRGVYGFAIMLCHWNISLFYIASELWANLVLALGFWGLVNEINTLDSAKENYGWINIGSNLSPIIGGIVGGWVASPFTDRLLGMAAWDASVAQIMVACALLSSIGMSMMRFILRSSPSFSVVFESHHSTVATKERTGLRQAISLVANSRYLAALALIVVGFNSALFMGDYVWKGLLKEWLVEPKLIHQHLNQISVITGALALVGALLFRVIVRKWGWLCAALATPLCMLLPVTVILVLRLGDASLFSLIGCGSPLAVMALMGSFQNAFSKGLKYSLFDAAKEMAFLPLPDRERRQGKAALDGLGSSIGKSGAAVVVQLVTLLCGGLASAAPFISAISVVVIIAWVMSALRVGGAMKAMQGAKADLGESMPV